MCLPLIGAYSSFWNATERYAATQKNLSISQPIAGKKLIPPVPGIVADDRLRIVGAKSLLPFLIRFECIRMCPTGDPEDSKRLYYLWLLKDKVRLPFESHWEYPQWNPAAFPSGRTKASEPMD